MMLAKNIARTAAAHRLAGVKNPYVAEAVQLNIVRAKAQAKKLEQNKDRDNAKQKEKKVHISSAYLHAVPTIVSQLPDNCDYDATRHPADCDVILLECIGDLTNKIEHKCKVTGATLQVYKQSAMLAWLFGKRACTLRWFEKRGKHQSVKFCRPDIEQFGWHFRRQFEKEYPSIVKMIHGVAAVYGSKWVNLDKRAYNHWTGDATLAPRCTCVSNLQQCQECQACVSNLLTV